MQRSSGRADAARRQRLRAHRGGLRSRRCAALLAAIGWAAVPARASAAACSYGGNGPSASTLCWLDMAGYSDVLARSAAGQPMSIDLLGGYRLSFTLRSRPVAGTSVHPAVDPRTAPLERRFAFGSSDFVGVAGSPVLYSRDAGAVNGVDLTLGGISVVDPSGTAVSGYRLVIADAENNVAPPRESFAWTSDRPLDLVGVMNSGASAGCQNSLTGPGSTTVSCIGQGTDPPSAPPAAALYDGVIVGANSPTTIGVTMTTDARSGVAFAIQTAKIQVTKQLTGRVRATDSVDLSVTSPEGSTIASASTGTAETATTGEVTVLPRLDGASYTLAEAATPASGTRLEDYAASWSCTRNGAADPSLPSGGGQSIAVSPAPGDDIDCTVTNAQLPADLNLTKTAASTRLTAGGEETYTLTVRNDGPSRATAVRVEDTLPSGLAFVSASPGCTLSASTVTCLLDTLDPGAAHAFAVTTRVGLTPLSCTQLTNVATVRSDTPDADPGDDVSSICVPQAQADLRLVKTGGPSPVVPGGEVTNRLDVSNRGPDAAQGVVVTDVLPRALTFVSASPGCSEVDGTVTCAIASLADGATASFAIAMRAPSSLSSCPSNTATVRSLTLDPNPADDESSACPPLRGRADLSIAKTASRTTVPVDGQVMYTLLVRNAGPSDATGVTVEDPLAPGLTLVSATPGQGECSSRAGRVVCDLGRLEAGGSTQVLVTATAPPVAGCPVNTATVRGDQQDPDAGDDTATARVCAVTAAPEPPTAPSPPADAPPGGSAQPFDLAVTKSANRREVAIGGRIRYRIRVANRGTTDAPDVRLTDTFAARGAIVSIRASQGRCVRRNPTTCALGTIRAGRAATVAVTLRPTSVGRAKRNVVSVTGSGTDTAPRSNIAGVTATVKRIRLRLTKRASRSSVRAGSTFSYVVAVANRTDGTARAVRVCDDLPAGIVHLRSKPSARLSGGKRCWTVRTLGPHAKRSFRIVVRALRGARGPRANTVTATSPVTRRARAKHTVEIRPVPSAAGGVTG